MLRDIYLFNVNFPLWPFLCTKKYMAINNLHQTRRCICQKMEAKLVSQQMRNKNSHPIYRKKKSQNVRKSIAHLTKNKCLNSGTTRCKANAFLTSHQIKLVRQMSEDINERNEKKIKMWFTFHYYFIVWSLFEKKFFFLLFIINFVSPYLFSYCIDATATLLCHHFIKHRRERRPFVVILSLRSLALYVCLWVS